MQSVALRILRSILLLGVAVPFVGAGCWKLTQSDGAQNTVSSRIGVYVGVAFALFLPAAMIARVEWEYWRMFLNRLKNTSPS